MPVSEEPGAPYRKRTESGIVLVVPGGSGALGLPMSTARRAGTNASTWKSRCAIAGPSLVARTAIVHVPACAPPESAIGTLSASSCARAGTVSENTCPPGRVTTTCTGTSSGWPAESRSSAIAWTVSPGR